MRIREYRYFLAIVEHGSVTAAAKALYTSQPALSVYLKGQEDQLGVKLFVKAGSKLILTSEGERYLDYARKIVQLDDNLIRELEDIRNCRAGKVRVGITVGHGSFFLPLLLKSYQKQFPQLTIELCEASHFDLIRQSLERKLDLILLNKPSKNFPLQHTKILSESMVLVAPKSFGLSQYAHSESNCPYPYLDIRKLQDVPLAMLKKNHSLRREADALFYAAGITPTIMYETDASDVAYSLVENKFGATFTYDIRWFLGKKDELDVFSVTGSSLHSRDYVIAYTDREDFSVPVRSIHDCTVQTIKGFFDSGNMLFSPE